MERLFIFFALRKPCLDFRHFGDMSSIVFDVNSNCFLIQSKTFICWTTEVPDNNRKRFLSKPIDIDRNALNLIQFYASLNLS